MSANQKPHLSELRVEGLQKAFGRRASVMAVDDFNVSLRKGELLVLLGPSGCGKTTVLRCIGGLETPTKGHISIGGHSVFNSDTRLDVPVHKRSIGMVFQNYALWPHMTVEENVGYPLASRARIARTERVQRVKAALTTVRCENLADRYPAQLSGGQQQRVALARALIAEPTLVLLDEPLSNLDAILRTELRAQLQTLHRKLGFTGVYVTHDQLEAFNLGDRIAVMDSGQIQQIGTPQSVYERPATTDIAAFLGVRNAIALVPEGASWRTSIGTRICLDPHVGSGVTEIRLRMGDVRLCEFGQSADANHIFLGQGMVEESLFSGEHNDYIVRLGTDVLFAVSDKGTYFAPGASVALFLRRTGALVYQNGRLTDTTVTDC